MSTPNYLANLKISVKTDKNNKRVFVVELQMGVLKFEAYMDEEATVNLASSGEATLQNARIHGMIDNGRDWYVIVDPVIAQLETADGRELRFQIVEKNNEEVKRRYEESLNDR